MSEEKQVTKLQMVIAWTIVIIVLVAGYFLITGLISFVSGVFSGPSEYTQEEIREIIELQLYEKYGEEFVVDRIGHRKSHNTVFYQARIYPKSIIGTNRQFDDYYYARASIDIRPNGELSGVADTYGEVMMHQEAKEYLRPVINQIFGERVLLKTDISYRRLRQGTFVRSAVHGFEEKLQKAVADPENIRMEVDLDVYIFKRIENEAEKEERREQIFEFVQYLKKVGLFDYLELGVIFIDERVLAPSYGDFAREIRTTREVREVIEGEAVRMPPRELRERMSIELQSEVEEMSEEELLASMGRIRKSDLSRDGIEKYNMSYFSEIFSPGILKERYATSLAKNPDIKKEYKIKSEIRIPEGLRYIYLNK